MDALILELTNWAVPVALLVSLLIMIALIRDAARGTKQRSELMQSIATRKAMNWATVVSFSLSLREALVESGGYDQP